MKKNWFLGLVFLVLFSCKNKSKIETVQRGFYYWKSNDWHIDSKLDSIMKETKTEKLYVKYFEVEYNDLMGNIPISKNRMRVDENTFETIPTIFIKNDVFLKSSL